MTKKMLITPKSRQIMGMKKFRKTKEVADNQSLLLQSLTLFGRDEATRTPDPYVPNVVRYQLRYIPILRWFSKNRVQRYGKNLNSVHF